ncbi:MAG: ribonuclease HI [Deltaproteobacteria bacterium]|nr:ribonuclease HI [Deltaproteobacteria bacterium]
MPWRRMRLRNAEVLARCDASGELVANDGRVEVRYKPNDGRAYFAGASNLTPPGGAPKIELDSFCGPGEAVKKPSKSKKKAGGTTTSATVALWADQTRELSEYIGEATNNIAELTGILRAVELARDLGRPLRLYTDSQYSIGVLTKGWKVKANKELVAKVREALDGHPDTKLFHVRGHQGVRLNEQADELAVRAVQSRESTGWVGP